MTRFGPYLLDPVNHTLSREGQRIELSPKTFGVLRHLVENRGRLLRHEELLAAVWPNTFVQPEILKTHIRVLRKALGDDAGAPRCIETRPRLGYRFIAEVVEEMPDRAAQPAAAHASASARSILPGRSEQTARLREALDSALAGERRMLFLTGGAGAGKSALLDAFAEEAATGRDLWLGRARGGAAEPLAPLIEILGGWCRSPGGASVRQMLALHAPSCRGLIAAALGPTAPERRRAGEGPPAPRAVREMADVLEAMAELRPMLLLLDDLHLADEATLALLGTLARRHGRRRVMVVASCRSEPLEAPHPLRRLMLDLLVHRAAEELPLPPLTRPDVAGWLAGLAAGRAAPDGLVDLLHEKAGGNPMLAGAILDHLLERKAVWRAEPRGWVVRHPLAPSLARDAPRAGQMLDLEIEAVAAEERRVLEAASVAGRDFCTWSIQVVLDMPAARAEELCRNLCRRGFLQETGQRTILPNGTASPRFAFLHGLFRDILHQRQAAAQRAVWHRCLGERAEANWGARAPVIAAELAYRFREGEDWRRAIHYSRHAAREALGGAGVEAALALLRHALEGCGHLPEAERAGTEAALRQDIARVMRSSGTGSPRALLPAPRGPDGTPAH